MLILYKKYFKENSDIKLKNKFNDFNKKYFNNSLNIKDIKYSSDFHSSFILGVYNVKSNTILINKNNLPEEILDLIILHEMIHVYNIQNNQIKKENDVHGEPFEKERKRINKFLKYEIPVKEDLNSIDKILDALGVE